MPRPPLAAAAAIVQQYGDASLAARARGRRPRHAGGARQSAAATKPRAITVATQSRSAHSCRNRPCPQCQGSAHALWLAARARETLAVPSCHVVCTRPAPLRPLALQHPQVVSTLLLQAVAETLQTIARDPKP